MPEERNIFVLRLSPQSRKFVADMYRQDNCKSQNEFIEKAIQFYTGYIAANDHSQYLSNTMTEVLRGSLGDFESRVALSFFRLTLETSMMMHVLASGLEITDEELKKLRSRCIEEVKRTNGRITFDGAVKFQNGV